MKILALDIANKTGWATKDFDGVENFVPNNKESFGMKFVRFKKWLKEITKLQEINLIVYEMPVLTKFSTGYRSGCNYESILIEFCEENKIEYTSYTPSEIKAFAKNTYQLNTKATLKGHMNKERMKAFAKEIFSMDIIDDNHADAIWLYELTKSKLI